MSNGRNQDILIVDEKYTDPRTGVEVVNERCFTVWADADAKAAIESVEGVTNVYVGIAGTQFYVYTDPRYDREFIKREIEASILCRGES